MKHFAATEIERKVETLTDAEIKLLAHAYCLRHDEQGGTDLWFCPESHLLDEAHRLVERGYLDPRRCGEDDVFRFTDEAMSVQESLTATAGREN